MPLGHFSFCYKSLHCQVIKRKWVDWAKSTESDEDLLIILDPIVNEIEDRMHDKLEAFQASFFGSLGAAVKKWMKPQGKVPSKR